MIDKNLFLPSESEPEGISFATISSIHEDGISLIFDGEDTPTQKHYKCNAFMVFKVGDRVKLERDSGTYIVAWSIGNPKTSFAADTATTATTAQNANTAQTAETANTATSANSADTATTATSAEYATEAGRIEDTSQKAYHIRFRVTTHGALEFNSSLYSSGTWYKLATV